jgi:uncharacterized membrane protein YciS (DUF1049 family)
MNFLQAKYVVEGFALGLILPFILIGLLELKYRMKKRK